MLTVQSRSLFIKIFLDCRCMVGQVQLLAMRLLWRWNRPELQSTDPDAAGSGFCSKNQITG